MITQAPETRASPQEHSVRMKSREFRKAREDNWQELERLLSRGSGLRRANFSAEELIRLPMLYRAALSSLSIARSIALDRSLEAYLGNLCLRAFLLIYAPGAQPSNAIAAPLLAIPRQLARLWRFILVAMIVLLVGVVSGYGLVSHEPGWDKPLLSVTMIGVDASIGENLFAYILPMCFLAAGLGLFGGLPTMLMLAWHGVFLGASIAHVRIFNAELPATHVMLELSVLALSQILGGAAGLLLGVSILVPGPYSRVDSVSLATSSIAQLISAAVVIMLIGSLLAWIAGV